MEKIGAVSVVIITVLFLSRHLLNGAKYKIGRRNHLNIIRQLKEYLIL